VTATDSERITETRPSLMKMPYRFRIGRPNPVEGTGTFQQPINGRVLERISISGGNWAADYADLPLNCLGAKVAGESFPTRAARERQDLEKEDFSCFKCESIQF
jgi:hypothetical protein